MKYSTVLEFLEICKNYLQDPQEHRVIQMYPMISGFRWYLNKNTRSGYMKYWRDGLIESRPEYKDILLRNIMSDTWTGLGLFFRFTEPNPSSGDVILRYSGSWPIQISTVNEIRDVTVNYLLGNCNKLIIYSGPFHYCPEGLTEEVFLEMWSSGCKKNPELSDFYVAWDYISQKDWESDWSEIQNNRGPSSKNPLEDMGFNTIPDRLNYIREHHGKV